jgi:hypothetical protein
MARRSCRTISANDFKQTTRRCIGRVDRGEDARPMDSIQRSWIVTRRIPVSF